MRPSMDAEREFVPDPHEAPDRGGPRPHIPEAGALRAGSTKEGGDMAERGPSYGADAVVTGAGGGIGRAIAEELVARGGRVLVADIDLGAVETVAKELGDRARAVRCDVASRGDVEAMREAARAFFGVEASVIVNNAGVGVGGSTIEDTTLEDWEWIVGVNLWGVIHGCRTFVPGIRRRGHGGVVNVASAASFGAAPRMGAYNVTKSGVVSLTETLHAELAGTGIRATALCPTFVKTNIIKNARMPSNQIGIAQAMMDRTGMDPRDVAKLTLDGLDAGRVHVVPQLDARVSWFLKRAAPGAFTRGMGFIGRFSPLAR